METSQRNMKRRKTRKIEKQKNQSLVWSDSTTVSALILLRQYHTTKIKTETAVYLNNEEISLGGAIHPPIKSYINS